MDTASRDYLDLCEESTELILVVSAGGVLTFANRSLCQALGYDPVELPGRPIRDLVVVEDLADWDSVVGNLSAHSPKEDVRLRFRGKGGGQVQLAGEASGRFEGEMLSALRIRGRSPTLDVTAENDLSRLFELSLDLLCVAGTDGFFKQINPAFERVLGYEKQELLSRAFLDFVHPEDRPSTIAAVERLASGLPVVDFQNRYLAKDGTYHWLAWRSAPWAEKGLIFAVARDITEQKRTQELLSRQAEELARSNHDLEQFAWVASHDLRAPLRSIGNLSEWIEEEIPGELPPGVQKNLGRLRRQVQRMETMIDDLLEFARAGHRTSEVHEVDVGSMIEEILHLLAPPDGFRFRVASGMPSFKTAKSALEQVFRNLISNAVRHHDRDQGEVSISVEKKKKHFVFEIRDDGPGIPAEFQEEVFLMFRRLKPSDEVKGTGIGLPLVKRIVEGYGGRIWLHSSGRGSAFFFEWPVVIAPPGEV